MDTAKQAVKVFAEAERQMRELVGEAASAGDYELAMRVTEWAKALGDLARCTHEEPQGRSSAAPVEKAPGPAKRVARRTRSARKTARRPGRDRKTGDYPRFVRRNDALVKIGWSKNEKAEYEHKAPKRVVELLASTLSQKAANGDLVTPDDFMPLVDPDDGTDVPSYQAYLCLAWLRIANLVKQQGRQGYLVPQPTALPSALERLWRQLPVA